MSVKGHFVPNILSGHTDTQTVGGSVVKWYGVGLTTTQWLRVRFPAAAANTGMGDRLSREENHFSISPSHPGQLSLIPSAGQEMSTSQSAVTLCGWGVKTDMTHSTCG